MHRSHAFCEPRVTAQAVPIRCDRQVNECWVAERDGLIKAVERFIEPACVPIQNGAEECHLQQRVEVQLRVRDLIHHESPHSGEAGRRVHLLSFGGSGKDSGWGIAVDPRGNPVVAGITDSLDLPGTAGSYQPVNRGKKDAFVASFQLRHGRRIRATYFGGASDDESGYDGGNVKVDRDGNVWFVGTTYSDDLPTPKGSQSRYGGGNGDGFIAAFDPRLNRLCFASYFGDKERNLLEGIAVSHTGLVAATGVSFADTPAPSLVQIGNLNLFAGHHVVLLPGSRACAPSLRH